MSYKQLLRNIADKLPYVRTLKNKVNFYESKLTVPPGHFYSPLVDVNEILEQENVIFNRIRNLEGVNLNEVNQFKLLEKFKKYYKLLSFPENPVEGKRYFYNNNFYSYADVIFCFQ